MDGLAGRQDEGAESLAKVGQASGKPGPEEFPCMKWDWYKTLSTSC